MELKEHLIMDKIKSHKQEKKGNIFTQNPGEGSSSSWETIINGILQGSVLGLLLFLN